MLASNRAGVIVCALISTYPIYARVAQYQMRSPQAHGDLLYQTGVAYADVHRAAYSHISLCSTCKVWKLHTPARAAHPKFEKSFVFIPFLFCRSSCAQSCQSLPRSISTLVSRRTCMLTARCTPTNTRPGPARPFQVCFQKSFLARRLKCTFTARCTHTFMAMTQFCAARSGGAQLPFKSSCTLEAFACGFSSISQRITNMKAFECGALGGLKGGNLSLAGQAHAFVVYLLGFGWLGDRNLGPMERRVWLAF